MTNEQYARPWLVAGRGVVIVFQVECRTLKSVKLWRTRKSKKSCVLAAELSDENKEVKELAKDSTSLILKL